MQVVSAGRAVGARNLLPRGSLPLGFGCGPLGIGLSTADSLRLLQTAIDCGITYFDTARMYGWGRAERILGRLAPRYRDRIIIASKAGILAPNRSLPRRMISRGVKFLNNAMPSSKSYIVAPEVWQPRYGLFKITELRASIETSLKQLRTEYLDIFLLHECKPTDVEAPELLEFMYKLKADGKVREFGIATGIEETLTIARTRPALTSVLQISDSIWEPNIGRLQPAPVSLTITHSSFGTRFRDLQHQLASDKSLARDWKSSTRIDPGDISSVAQLILARAVRRNASGVVLFSSTKPDNIRANVQAVEQKVIEADQIDGLDAFVDKHALGTTKLGPTAPA